MGSCFCSFCPNDSPWRGELASYGRAERGRGGVASTAVFAFTAGVRSIAEQPAGRRGRQGKGIYASWHLVSILDVSI